MLANKEWESVIQIVFFSEYNMKVLIFCVLLGKIQTFLGDLETGVRTLEKALTVIEVTHGATHPTVQQLREVIAESSEEYRQQRLNSVS